MKNKIGNKEIRQMLAIFLVLPMLMPVSIVQAADDANIKEVGVEWAQNYAPCGIGNLYATKADAEGFYNALGNRGWTKVFNYGDGLAWESDFEKAGVGGSDTIYGDTVDFAYLSGHGSSDSFWFGTPHDGNNVLPCRIHTSEVSWGETDLDWLVLSDCLSLQYLNGNVFTRWRPAFQGLHLILGYDTTSADYGTMGSNFVYYMTRPWWLGGAQKIKNAWFSANIDSQPSDVWSAALGTCTSWNDYLPGYGAVSADGSNSCMTWQRVQS